MKKHLDLKNNKVLLVLFSLLFLTTAVHTLALIRVEDRSNQPAQVVKSDGGGLTLASSCVSVAKEYNKFFSNPFEPIVAYDYTSYLDLNITNNCAYPISVINPATLNTNSAPGVLATVSYTGVDYLDNLDHPAAVALPSNNLGITPSFEIGTCFGCPNGATQYRASPVGTYPYQGVNSIESFTIPVGQTRRFELDLGINVPDTNFMLWLRTKPTKIKWFYDSAYGDGIISAGEIQTKTFTAAEQKVLATDYVMVPQSQ